MLRWIIIVYALLYLVGAAVLLAVVHAGLWAALYLAVNGVVILGAVLFERRRYRPALPGGSQGWEWQDTGERFVDPSSGQVMEVRYNATTGERDYVPAGQPTPPHLPEK
jgi:hypothetical protein